MTVRAAIEPKTLAVARAFAERIRRDFSVKQILLYGSRARGDHHADSDVDIAVVLPRSGRRKIDLTLAMGELAQDFLLEDLLFLTPYPVWEEEWADPSLANNPWLIAAIQEEGVTL